MNCPKCGYSINAGRELARLNKGKTKVLTDDERERRRERLKVNRAKRWPVKPQTVGGS